MVTVTVQSTVPFFFFCENNVVVNFVNEDTIRFQLVEIKKRLISNPGLELSLNMSNLT